jgi:3-dehydroquinate synthase
MTTDRSLHGFSVPFEFPVVFTEHVFAPSNPVFADVVGRLEPARRHRVLVVVDDQVAEAWPRLTEQILDYFDVHGRRLQLVEKPFVTLGGERSKNDFLHALAVVERINATGLDRQSFVAVVGGGAVLDVASFGAAIAHRGVRVIRVPTTVLAQADSGVGVKNGINFFGKKNFVGTFAPPFAVVNDVRFLDTLPLRDRVAGSIEALKVAVLKDPEFFEEIEASADRIRRGEVGVLATLVRRSAVLHLAHICGNGDPFELGSARPLDFGHWAAHRLESITHHRLRHGEAVAIGLALDLTYSVRKGFLAEGTAARVLATIDAMGFSLWDDALVEQDPAGRHLLLDGLHEFREHLGGELHITLLRDIGRGFEVTEMDEAVILESLDTLAARRPAAVAR